MRTTGGLGFWRRSISIVCALLVALASFPSAAFAMGTASLTAVSDLSAQAQFAQGAAVSWTAPTGTGGVAAASYDLRYSTSPITDLTFAAATPVSGLLAPQAPGSPEEKDVTGLAEGTHYYFALKWTDAGSVVSPISNVAQITTLAHDEFVLKTVAAPAYAPNDYSTFAFQFSCDSFYPGLDPNSNYYYRVVLSANPLPNAATDRGWTVLNSEATNSSWASPADSWSSCPAVQTDGNGKPNSGPRGVWATLRVGDTRMTGVRYANVLMIKRDASGAPIPGSEKHSINPSAITIFDPNTTGAWLHNGTPNPNGDSRLAVTDLIPWPNHHTWSVAQGYPRWSEPDDPYYGPSDQWSGSVRFAVPLGLGPMDIRRGNQGQTSWTDYSGHAVTGLQVTTPGASYAFGASDFVPPTAPTGISASSLGYPKDIRLNWSGASDNLAVTGYFVYRWQDIDPGLPYTPMKLHIATVRGATSYLDSNVTLGQTYHYEVRAIDTATNVSPAIAVSATSQNSVGPAAITDLNVTPSGTTAAALSWTAVSSASAVGTTAVTSYDLRYSAKPIVTDADFAAATPVTVPGTPGAPGFHETFTLSNKLFGGQTYYFSIRAVDAVALKGPLSNSPSVTMPVGQAFTLSAGSVVAPSNVPNDQTAIAIQVGGPGWVTSGLAANARYLARAVFSEGSSEDRSTDRGWTAYGAGYPNDGWRQLSEPWESLVPASVAPRCILSTDAGGQLPSQAPVIARFGDTRMTGSSYHVGVELVQVDGSGNPMPGTTKVLANAATVNVFDAATQGSGVLNGWAPGDAAASNLTITAAGAPTVPVAAISGYPAYFGEEPPGVVSPGAFSMSLPLTVSSFDVRKDGVVWSAGGTPLSYTGLARVAGASYALGSSTEPIPVAPAAVTVANADPAGLAGKLRLTWTQIGADAAGYRVYRWQDAPAGALYTPPKVWIQTTPGSLGTYTDTGLTEGATYHYEIRAVDAAGNMSPPFGFTGTCVDRVAPARIMDASVVSTSSGSVTLHWTAPADTNATSTNARAASYDIRYATSPISTPADFAAATPVSDVPTPAIPGSSESFTVNHLNNGATYWFAIRTADVAGNVSDVSNSPSGALPALPTYSLEVRSAPNYVANDYTPSLFQIGTPATGSGLLPNATYYYKLVFSQRAQHETATDRGWTANGNETPHVTWVQADQAWTGFPTLTTDDLGAIVESSSNGLDVFGAFGDTRLTGDRYLQVVLARKSADTSAVVAGSEVYPSTPFKVTVFDPETHGAWVHNGVPNTLGSARVALAPAQGSAISYALSEGYPRWLYGPGDDPYYEASLPGSFRMAVPDASGTFGVYTGNGNSRVWMAQEGFVVTLPGASYAAGAADMVPPSAPDTITASSADQVRSILVSWSGAADDLGVAGYYVYRWQDAPTGAHYTPQKQRIAKVLDGEEYLDQGVDLGQTYHYEVRAFDDATNVSPGIETVGTSENALGPRPILNLAVTRTGASSVHLTWTAPSTGASAAVSSYELRRSSTPILTVADFTAATPLPVGTPGAPGAAQSCDATGLPTGVNYFSIRSVDGAGGHSALSNTVSILMSNQTAITIAVSPTSVKLPKPFVLSGYLTGGRNGDWCVVWVKKPGSSRWSYSSNRVAYNGNAGGATWWYRYSPKLRGTYSFYAVFSSDSTRVGSKSKTVTEKVK